MDMMGCWGMMPAFSRGHHEGGGEATITISTASDKKKKNKKKKKKPSIHVVGPMVKDSDRGFGTIQSWVIGGKSIDHSNISHLPGDGSSSNNRGSSNNSPGSSVKSDESSDIESNVHDSNLNRGIVRGGVRKGRGIISDLWDMGQQAVDAVAEHAVESDLKEDGLTDKSSFE
ncbi:uncharacterized protein LOC113238465, partial [Hyposmocoma kahamanoa]|uniref:uncharacterized protein LOC113238465 n=1 Tax=Hyposmocoma kahamanoa TaxID=1477025 RepID=UPI000E6D8977